MAEAASRGALAHKPPLFILLALVCFPFENASMQLPRFFFGIALLLAPVALLGTTWLYLYPLFDSACSFPEPPHAVAPFRLLALGDPQLEGDSSLPKAGAPVFRSLQSLTDNVRNAESVSRVWDIVREALIGVPKDLRRAVEGYIRKPIDIWGNDWYLAHIVRTLRWWTRPSHVAVMGDLLGSQWVSDEEFERRSKRYWDVVFRGMEKVPDRVMLGGEEGEGKRWGGTLEVLGADADWENRVINIAGNHDIGYAGDIDERRIERFENRFGKVNWDIMFTLPNTSYLADTAETEGEQNHSNDIPALRVVVLNSMNIDTPASKPDLQLETYNFINQIITTSRSVRDKTYATVLLTHIPLHKEPGVCADSPFFAFFESGGIKEQNMLSEHASKIVLESIFGMSSSQYVDGQGFGRRGIIINGHDHAGCDVLHYTTQEGVESQCPENIEEHEIQLPRMNSDPTATLSTEDTLDDTIVANKTIAEEEPQSRAEQSPMWQALRFPHLPYKATEDGGCIALDRVPRIREVTLRAMMGEFSGYAGFLSAWFDPSLGEKGEWQMELNTCGLGMQHWWWSMHIVDLVLILALVLGGMTAFFRDKENKEKMANKKVAKNEKWDRKAESKGTEAISTQDKTGVRPIP